MTEPSDAHPEAARLQLELLRKAGTRGRLALTLRLSNAMIAASRRAIRKRHPELSEQEVRLLWAELHYGKELADRVRAHLAKIELALARATRRRSPSFGLRGRGFLERVVSHARAVCLWRHGAIACRLATHTSS
jgi:hypothetical protein